ncbi:MAG: 2-C-methyl-D-erythritol 4-phosphate cytidylyltransferase [Alistipes sp.]|nr:2-C-methyl-D-erythritol 4-phosphate cytidylyltransferase [Alistipes sp.]
MEEPRVGVIIVAGGSGKRMGGALPKQFSLVGGEPILARTINAFRKALPTSRIVVVLPAEYIEFWKNFSARFDVAKHSIVEGGKERFHSVRNGIAALSDAVDLIAVQDGVRPFASKEMILRAVACAAEKGSAIPVVKAVDSYRTIEGEESRITDRTLLRIVQTPQIFSAPILRAAYDTDFRSEFTDDASVVEYSGECVSLCEGEYTNIKITTPTDMVFAEAIVSNLGENNNNEE